LGARIVGEGGNLGCSQAGRIEFAQHGGLINTDAIDNSGGVDSSDHEVNIKILLSQVVDNGDMTLKQRNTLLASMTDEVADLVLNHNYHQSLVLSIAHHTAPANLHNHKRLIHHLESLDRLNRALEGLPSDAQIDEHMRQQECLSRPEIAVLLAYSKMHLFDELMQAGIADDPYLSQALSDYFPQPLQAKFAGPMGKHPLRSEIIATHVTNQIGNRMGASFFHLLQEETGAGAGDIARAFMAASHILQAPNMWQQLDQVTLQLNYSQAMALHGQ
ncbi:MAG: NAD-glutamate dehydrogenase, partial [Gammaproteobacteria bacterium]|nr:NAD-glutamate dehydrogenase [Gammaproteobacteria bacterium]